MIISPATPTLNYGNLLNRQSLNRGLLSWWLVLPQRGKGNTWFDLSAHERNHGTLTNGPTWSSMGPGYGSLLFDGTNDWVRMSGTDTILSGLTTATIAASVRLESTGANQNIFGIRDDTGTDFYVSYINGTGNLEARCRTSVINFDLTPSFSAYVGTWARIAVVRNGASLIAYINGVSVASRADVSGNWGTSEDFRLGVRKPSSVTDPFKGRMDDIKVAVRAWCADDVWLDYREWQTRYPTTLNRIRLPVVGEVAAPPGGTLPALDQGMLTGGLSTLGGGLI